MANQYEKELAIDQFKLDREWSTQSNRYMDYSEKSANAESEMNQAKENVDCVLSELYIQIKSAKEEAGEKITEKYLDALIKTDEKYKQAYSDYMKASLNHKMLQGAVRAFDHRKSALENLARLQIAGFYSDPRDSKVEEEKSDRKSDVIKQKLNSKERKA